MQHSFTIDTQRKQRSQRKRLLETVTLLVGRLSVVIMTVLLLIGLSLVFLGLGNVAHAANAKNLTQERTAITSSKDVVASTTQDGEHREHGGRREHREHEERREHREHEERREHRGH